MSTTSETSGVAQAGNGLAGFQRFWPLDDDASGYGVAAYIGTRLIICRLYNLQTNEMLAMLKEPGDYASLSGSKLIDVLGGVFDRLSAQAGIALSKLTVAVVTGTTAMENKAVYLSASKVQQGLEEELGEFGRDVEYMLAGASSIAVGQAFLVPCLSPQVGGDFLCSLLAIDMLGSDKPLLFVNVDPHDASNVVLAYGHKDMLSVCVLPEGTSVEEAMVRLLEVCEAEYEHIEHALLSGDAELPAALRDRTQQVGDAAIEGASAVLLSEMAEDELCRIASTCRILDV